jgi:hypothetical protein
MAETLPKKYTVLHTKDTSVWRKCSGIMRQKKQPTNQIKSEESQETSPEKHAENSDQMSLGKRGKKRKASDVGDGMHLGPGENVVCLLKNQWNYAEVTLYVFSNLRCLHLRFPVQTPPCPSTLLWSSLELLRLRLGFKFAHTVGRCILILLSLEGQSQQYKCLL